MSTLYNAFNAGTITNNPLAAGGTSITSAGFASLPVVVAPDFLWLSLDPLGSAGPPEIVKVTAHAASSTTVTVQRGQQTSLGGGAARSHASGTVWQHVITPEDLDMLRPLGVDFVATEESISAPMTEPANLATPGPAVTLTTGTLVRVTSMAEPPSPNTSNSSWMVEVSGATTIPWNQATEGHLMGGNYVNNPSEYIIPVNAGVNTFTMKYFASSGTATFKNRRLVVECLN